MTRLILLFAHYHGGYDLDITPYGFLTALEVVRITGLSTRKKLRGMAIIALGCLVFGVGLAFWLIIALGYLPEGPAQI